MTFRVALVIALCALCFPAHSATFKVTPVGPENIQVRYLQGEPTIYLINESGGLLVASRGLHDGKRLVLDIVAFNNGGAAQNFGTENISLVGQDGKAITVFGYEELVRQEKKKAGWAKFWLGLAGVAGVIAANESAYSTYHGTYSSRYGTSTFYAESYNPSVAAANVAAVTAATGYGFARIQGNLEDSLAQLNNTILRTTTIDPGRAFGGRVVTDGIKGKYPRSVTLKLVWGGAEHLVEFVVTKGNQPTPVIPVAASLDATEARLPSDPNGGYVPSEAEGYEPTQSPPYETSVQHYARPPNGDVRHGVVIPYPEETD